MSRTPIDAIPAASQPDVEGDFTPVSGATYSDSVTMNVIGSDSDSPYVTVR